MSASAPSSSPRTLSDLSDPAINLHSEAAQVIDVHVPIVIDSEGIATDDAEALYLQRAEVIAAKTKQGIVIQHRAWNVSDIFRSDEDHVIVSPLRNFGRIDHQSIGVIAEMPVDHIPPSSPPPLEMPLISSPIVFPPSPSPDITAKKSRPHPGLERVHPTVLGGFLIDDDDDSNDDGDDQVLELLCATSHHETVDDSNKRRSSLEELDLIHPPLPRDATAEPDRVLPLGVNSASQGLSELFSQQRRGNHFDSRRKRYAIQTCSGKRFETEVKPSTIAIPFERVAAARSSTRPGRASRDCYGIEIHKLIEDVNREKVATSTEATTKDAGTTPLASIEVVPKGLKPVASGKRTVLWTEKYRAKRYIDLVGDERTHRSVLGWLKSWDPIVFGPANREKPRTKPTLDPNETHLSRKVLLLTGPPGLGKTTLAHVCANHAGYDALEINASDDRSRDVVKGRIRECVGTENVMAAAGKSATNSKGNRLGRPLCVIVDEVDGVYGGAGGGGEGGFIHALVDLVLQDQKNSMLPKTKNTSSSANKRKPKNLSTFRLSRPIILVCNDAYHPSLRPLRQSGLAETVHVRRPLLSQVVPRIQSIFHQEGYPCDADGVRRLCEAVWGTSSRRDANAYTGSVEGDLRGVLVVAEWIASKLRSSCSSSSGSPTRMTRTWLEQHIIGGLSHGGGEARALGRGNAREAVDRVFLEGAGFQKPPAAGDDVLQHGLLGEQLSVTEMSKKYAMGRLRELVESCGEADRVMTDCFSAYPTYSFRDDSTLSKPDRAYEWLHFHDAISSKVFSGQEWELSEYLSQPILAFHYLFASPAVRTMWTGSNDHTKRHHQRQGMAGMGDGDDEVGAEPLPFTGVRADYEAREAEKQNRSILSSLLASFSVSLSRCCRSPEDVATEFLPYLVKMVAPDVRPVVVGGSGADQRGVASVRTDGERRLVQRAASVMDSVGISFQRCRLDTEASVGRAGTWVFRMEPPLDALSSYETAGKAVVPPTRYAIRQVLDQEHRKYTLRRQNEARQARFRAGGANDGDEAGGYQHGSSTHAINSVDVDQEKEQMTGPESVGTKRDFFGRPIINHSSIRISSSSGIAHGSNALSTDAPERGKRTKTMNNVPGKKPGQENVWVSYHEGFSNAVRKPITLDELLRSL